MIECIRNAIRDFLRAVGNTIEDEAAIRGAGAFKIGKILFLVVVFSSQYCLS
ncbi:hypothetical protein HanRHA438_Chr15g0694161 [Helianthus annuus]|uniref:Uncharacterized protein n=1 Tax=Helianthus annuus TaxID=4232 RepID=A0A9K3DZR3_HELAN|nr:hypothetical protein HanXRQr2_Chr15g0682081 [Helianthus annuus]KAJ0843698.1 hypothetical protein HanRHA438_Chr15g0694161 [Helianthus annuus]